MQSTLAVPELICERVRGGLCFDIGAYHGVKSESYLGMGAKVVCVEPDPENVRAIRDRLGDRVKILGCAMGSEPGTGTLMLSNASTLNTLSEEFVRVAGKTRFRGYLWPRRIAVVVSTIGQMVKEFGVPQYCKIDVEGYEEAVLRGMDEPLPFLSFEFTPELKKNADACAAILSGKGDYVYNFSPGETKCFRLPEWREWTDVSRRLDEELDFGDVYAILRSETGKG